MEKRPWLWGLDGRPVTKCGEKFVRMVKHYSSKLFANDPRVQEELWHRELIRVEHFKNEQMARRERAELRFCREAYDDLFNLAEY